MFTKPTLGFRGFVWEPTSEQEVVALFGRMLPVLDIPLAIEHGWTAFPDCAVIDTAADARASVEFEYRSRSFLRHLNEWAQLRAWDATADLWLVCWLDDLTPDQKKKLNGTRVIDLRARVREHDRGDAIPLVLNWYEGPTDDATQKFAWRVQGLSVHQLKLIDRLRRLGEESMFAVEWPKRPDLPWFKIWDKTKTFECFKVYANGMISFSFSRWKRLPRQLTKRDLLGQLRDALNDTWFDDQDDSKKGRDLGVLLRDARDTNTFFDVWRSLATDVASQALKRT